LCISFNNSRWYPAPPGQKMGIVKREPIIDRISIGLTQKELDAYWAALRVLYRCGSETELYINSMGASGRARLARHAVWAFCKAIVRQGGFRHPPLACDLRDETATERAERLGQPVPEASADGFSPEWFRAHFPDRCI
jgi:hypothetical protein